MSNRTPYSMATPLGRMTDRAARESKKYEPMIKVERTGRSKADGKLNLRAVAEVLAERGLDPTVELVRIIQSKSLAPELEAKLLTTLMEYVHPKKKSVEITGAEGGPVQIENVSDAMLVQIAMQGLAEEIDLDDEPKLIEASPAGGDEAEVPWPFPSSAKSAPA